MLRNYFKIALRSLVKNSVYSFINIAGLAVGLACSILLLLWVTDELSFDKFHSNANQIHQLWINATYDGRVNSFNSVPFPSKDELKTKDSRIKNTAMTDWGSGHL
ncbi:MAG: ABC transporter permease, partial [Chryseolinea sp.]